MLWGRPAVSIWLLAAVLHGPALSNDFTANLPGLPEAAAAAVLQIASAAATATLGLALLLAARRRRTTPPVRANLAARMPGARSLISTLLRRPYASRPPPDAPFALGF
jgi:NADH:ubiquinone oxidoreductase subunit K